jgi:hypothetical protein
MCAGVTAIPVRLQQLRHQPADLDAHVAFALRHSDRHAGSPHVVTGLRIALRLLARERRMRANAGPRDPGVLPASRAYAGGSSNGGRTGAWAGAGVDFVARAGAGGDSLVPQLANASVKVTILIRPVHHDV